MNTKAKGEKAQLIVMGEIAKYDIPILLPLSDNLPFDFVAYHNGRMKKIQVKSTDCRTVTGAASFKLKTSNWHKKTFKGYTKDDCDLIICYDHTDNEFYLLGPEDFLEIRDFAVRKTQTKNKQSKGINLHENFVLSKERFLSKFDN